MFETGIKRKPNGVYVAKVSFREPPNPEATIYGQPLTNLCPSGTFGDEFRFRVSFDNPVWRASWPLESGRGRAR